MISTRVHREHRATAALLVLFGGLLLTAVFGPAAKGEFIGDDIPLVEKNEQLDDPQGWRSIVSQYEWKGTGMSERQAYHPVPMLTFWLEGQLWGRRVIPSRVVNMAVHLACACLIMMLLSRWTGQWTASILAATLFLVHPSATEPVMLLTGRCEALGALLSLLALQVWPSPLAGSGRAWGRALGSSLLCAAASLSEEIYFLSPALIVMLVIWNPRGHKGPRWRYALCVLPILGVAAVALFRRALGISSSLGGSWTSPVLHLQHLATILWHYFHQFIAMQNGRTTASFVSLGTGWAVAVLLGFSGVWAGLSYWVHRGSAQLKAVFFAMGWFVVFLAPHVLSIPATGIYTNRYAYFPSVGLCIILAVVFSAVQRVISPRWRRWAWIPIALAVLLVSLRTQQEARAWSSSLSLYGADIRRAPDDGYAQYHYALALRQRSGCRAAVRHFELATRYAPEYSEGWHDLAECLIDLGFPKAAVHPARQATYLSPASSGAHYTLAVALINSGRMRQAIGPLQKALSLDPFNPEALMLRQQILGEIGEARKTSTGADR